MDESYEIHEIFWLMCLNLCWKYTGEKWHYVSGIIVLENLYGCGVAYTITAASSIRYIFITNNLTFNLIDRSCLHFHHCLLLLCDSIHNCLA